MDSNKNLEEIKKAAEEISAKISEKNAELEAKMESKANNDEVVDAVKSIEKLNEDLASMKKSFSEEMDKLEAKTAKTKAGGDQIKSMLEDNSEAINGTVSSSG